MYVQMDHPTFPTSGRLSLYKSSSNVRKVIDRSTFLGLNIFGRFLRCILGEPHPSDGISSSESVRLASKTHSGSEC